MKRSEYPPGWDEERVRGVAEYYETQSDEGAAREHEEALAGRSSTLMEVPRELVPAVREMIAKHQHEKEAEG